MLKRVTRSNDNEFQISALEFDFKTFLEVYRESVKIYSLKNFKKYSGDVALYYLLVACRQAFMSMADNSMEKFGMPADFSDTRILLDWADLIIEKFT